MFDVLGHFGIHLLCVPIPNEILKSLNFKLVPDVPHYHTNMQNTRIGQHRDADFKTLDISLPQTNLVIYFSHE